MGLNRESIPGALVCAPAACGARPPVCPPGPAPFSGNVSCSHRPALHRRSVLGQDATSGSIGLLGPRLRSPIARMPPGPLRQDSDEQDDCSEKDHGS